MKNYISTKITYLQGVHFFTDTLYKLY